MGSNGKEGEAANELRCSTKVKVLQDDSPRAWG